MTSDTQWEKEDSPHYLPILALPAIPAVSLVGTRTHI